MGVGAGGPGAGHHVTGGVGPGAVVGRRGRSAMTQGWRAARAHTAWHRIGEGRGC
jgi:hypothetical protein